MENSNEKTNESKDKSDQCQHCGRMKEDWKTNRPAGTKQMQRGDNEDRVRAYLDWHKRSLPASCYGNDFDSIEWRIKDGKWYAVALLELTRLDGNVNPPPSYFESILNRMTKRDSQAELACVAAKILGCEAWVVLWRHDLSEFWVYNLSNNQHGWFHLSPEQYKKWLVVKLPARRFHERTD